MCLALGAGTAAFAAASSSRQHDRSLGFRSTHAHISPLLTKHFAVLRSAHTTTAVSSLPNMIQGMENSNDPSSALGLDVPATRVEPVNGGTVWFVPGNAGACVATQPPGYTTGTVATCGTAASDTNGLEGVMKDPTTGTATYWGVAPDGVVSVAVHSLSGRVTKVPVRLNAFIVTGHHVRSLSFQYVEHGRSHSQTVARLLHAAR